MGSKASTQPVALQQGSNHEDLANHKHDHKHERKHERKQVGGERCMPVNTQADDVACVREGLLSDDLICVGEGTFSNNVGCMDQDILLDDVTCVGEGKPAELDGFLSHGKHTDSVGISTKGRCFKSAVCMAEENHTNSIGCEWMSSYVNSAGCVSKDKHTGCKWVSSYVVPAGCVREDKHADSLGCKDTGSAVNLARCMREDKHFHTLQRLCEDKTTIAEENILIATSCTAQLRGNNHNRERVFQGNCPSHHADSAALSATFPPLQYMFDACLWWWLYCCSVLTLAVITLRFSRCQDIPYYPLPTGFKPASDVLRHDPWFDDYPCGPPLDWRKMPTGFLVDIRNTLLHTINNPASNAWMQDNWLWATPVISLRYNFWQGGEMVFVLLAVVFVPLFLPRWWYHRGGRTTVMVVARLAGLGFPAIELLFFRDLQRTHTAFDSMNPIKLGVSAMVKTGCSGLLSLPLQLYTDLAAGSLLVLGASARHDFRPPSTWIRQLVAGIALGQVINIGVSFLAVRFIFPQLQARVLHGYPLQAAGAAARRCAVFVYKQTKMFLEKAWRPLTLVTLVVLYEWWFDQVLKLL